MDAKQNADARRGAWGFDGFVLDLDRAELSDATGAVVALRPKVFALLGHLLDHAGRVAERKAILDTVWPGVTVGDESLSQAVAELRRALGGRGPRLIRTIPRRGYLLDAIRTQARPSPPDGDSGEGFEAGVGFAPAFATPTFATAGESPGATPSTPTVAILAFTNLSGETRWDRLCDGLSEDIVTDLARHPDLRVIARHSSFFYRGRPTDLRTVGRALGARYVVEGSVQADAGRIRVTAQLIEAASGTHAWAARYDRSEEDLFAVQDEVVARVVTEIAGFGGAIPRAELGVARRRPPANLRAYELYLLGYEQEARLDREGTLRAIELLEAALEADPQLSRAWTVLGLALGNAGSNGWAEDLATVRARQREAARRASALDPSDGLALVELGVMLARDGDLDGSRDALERAIVAGAGSADTLALLAKYVAEMLGRPEQATALMDRALRLNPHAPSWYHLGAMRVAYFAAHFGPALDAARRAPPMRNARLFEALALARLGRLEDAAEAATAFRAAHPEFRAMAAATRLPLVCPRARSLFLEGAQEAGLPK